MNAQDNSSKAIAKTKYRHPSKATSNDAFIVSFSLRIFQAKHNQHENRICCHIMPSHPSPAEQLSSKNMAVPATRADLTALNSYEASVLYRSSHSTYRASVLSVLMLVAF